MLKRVGKNLIVWVPSSLYVSDVVSDRNNDVIVAIHLNHLWPVDFDYFKGYVAGLAINVKSIKTYILPKAKKALNVRPKFKMNGDPYK
jgi:hypothetical protein